MTRAGRAAGDTPAEDDTSAEDETSPADEATTPGRDCPLCPRLVAFRTGARAAEPLWFNAPVPTLGAPDARLMIVGLAPGLRGANRTGRPFTGDYAGMLLYETLIAEGFATGPYEQRPDDALALVDCAVTNSVRCVPPQNKPMPEEIKTCRRFLDATLARWTRLRAVVVLGRIAHEATVRACGGRLAAHPFAHGRRHELAAPGGRPIAVFDSYHCSRYNTNTGVLTPPMFGAVIAAARAAVQGSGD